METNISRDTEVIIFKWQSETNSSGVNGSESDLPR